jgi:hypothetical protein
VERWGWYRGGRGFDIEEGGGLGGARMVSMVMYVWDSLAFLIVLKLNDLEGDLNFHPCLEF